jgi:hypothetical protein
MRLSFTMIAPTFRRKHVERWRTIRAIPMKYSSQLGLSVLLSVFLSSPGSLVSFTLPFTFSSVVTGAVVNEIILTHRVE